jgi:hypothetical protein
MYPLPDLVQSLLQRRKVILVLGRSFLQASNLTQMLECHAGQQLSALH